MARMVGATLGSTGRTSVDGGSRARLSDARRCARFVCLHSLMLSSNAMKSLALTFLLLLPALAVAATQNDYTPSFERGRDLYEAHCQHCHTASIHARPNQLPLTRDELAGIV